MLNGSACDVVQRSIALTTLYFVQIVSKDKPMSDVKHNKYASRLAEDNLSQGVNGNRAGNAPPRARVKQNGSDVTSWDAYRNWLTKVQAPEQRRSLPDPALFSFKGYRSWAEKVRRDWETDD
jgi:hypothetical protein